tara:strand:- start:248 stop:1105 length:858 start_codon:yes stop_codon:yes gene_type:complete
MIKLKDLLKENPKDFVDKNIDSKELLYRKKKYYVEAAKIKKVKNVSVQYMDAEYLGDMAFSGYFKKVWLYKKDNGEYFAVVITNNRNRYEVQLGKHKDKFKAEKAAEKIIKKNLNKFESINEGNVTYKLKGFTNTKMDELDAELSRLGIKGTPDFNKMTYTIHMKGSNSYTLDKIMKKKGGKKIRESINEAPGRNHKDQYYGAARVKVEPYTYKNQVRNFHDVSMYRDHQPPYNYYLSIRLAHNKTTGKVDHIVDTGTHILKKAGKWAQGFIKRRMSGTGRERFS